MNPKSLFAIRHWSLTDILFLAAGCFAVGAVGFFISVFLQLQSGTSTQKPAVITLDEKVQATEQPYDRGDGKGLTGGAPPASQADAKDPYAAQKLKLMETPVQR